MPRETRDLTDATVRDAVSARLGELYAGRPAILGPGILAAFPGGSLVGIGLGIMLGDFFAWLLIGIGAGFVLMGFIAAIARR